ncbi:MAG TPA: phosphoribosylglycinamide synthetase C domain-containing protein [Candidatus Avalokitesvara rifleensis]|uniref:phosphoribosylglycinamide synthetase C domain-containing protein n=1 Tax=Candidatus Avalokitesvara rifleensis TaxID=3367620 RepID=UPI002712DC7A|nr:phosphoribosylglycinamide synthetase C domain-containing protein [Candidatus Brocadiales bacterium]
MIEKTNSNTSSDKKPDPKNFLFVSIDALITDIAWQVVKEGHNVRYYIASKGEREIGDGFVPKVDNWEAEIEWADVIVFDDVLGQGTKAKKLREQGKSVIGGTPYTDRLEDERAFGQEELKKAGINVANYGDFTSFDAAIDFVKQNPDKYVLKPSGQAQNIKGLLFIGEEDDGRDVIQVLGDYKKAWANKIPSFQLQKRITGVEVAVGAFFDGKEFIYPINVNFEHKKFFPGNLGPSTGEMGTSMFWSDPNKLFNATLKKFEQKLAEEGYVGYIDINCIVNKNGIYPLEWTTRFGYPTISIQQEGMAIPIGEFLYDLAKGNKPKLKVKSGFQIGVRIVVPPFPFKDKETFEVKSKDSVIFFKKPTEGVHIEDVALVNDEWLVSGTSGVVLIVCGVGQTMKQAQYQVYSRIKNILIPNMYYRTDIGNRWFEDSDKLHNWGYLREV